LSRNFVQKHDHVSASTRRALRNHANSFSSRSCIPSAFQICQLLAAASSKRFMSALSKCSRIGQNHWSNRYAAPRNEEVWMKRLRRKLFRGNARRIFALFTEDEGKFNYDQRLDFRAKILSLT
jgi:hypothetical protein